MDGERFHNFVKTNLHPLKKKGNRTRWKNKNIIIENLQGNCGKKNRVWWYNLKPETAPLQMGLVKMLSIRIRAGICPQPFGASYSPHEHICIRINVCRGPMCHCSNRISPHRVTSKKHLLELEFPNTREIDFLFISIGLLIRIHSVSLRTSKLENKQITRSIRMRQRLLEWMVASPNPQGKPPFPFAERGSYH